MMSRTHWLGFRTRYATISSVGELFGMGILDLGIVDGVLGVVTDGMGSGGESGSDDIMVFGL